MKVRLLFVTVFVPLLLAQQTPGIRWSGTGNNPQHTAASSGPAQPLSRIHWSTPVDLNPVFASGDLDIHYGSPVITEGNTVIVPVKFGSADGFQLRAFNGTNGSPVYTLTTDYTLPPHNWTPPYGPVLASSHRGRRITVRLYYAGAGGTVYFRDQVDSATGTTGQIAFYGNSLYSANQAAFNAAVQISTPLVADRSGNVYFGFYVNGPNPANLTGGIARISANGDVSWVSARAAAANDPAINQAALNCAPALSNDERTLYFAVTTGSRSSGGYLVSVDSQTLAPRSRVLLLDPRGGLATVTTDSSASPTVGPDGDIYFGVIEGGSSHNGRGWLLHFDGALAQTKTPGSFGWDDTASIVPASLVTSYTGTSPYLILTKYNNYADLGLGDGVNRIALLDPNAGMQDAFSKVPVTVMREVMTITGVTPDTGFALPNAVREWCINTAAIDFATRSAIVNNEDGVVYRWDFATNSFTERLRLTDGIGEAYTPTVIGPDGTSYAINDAILFAVGN